MSDDDARPHPTADGERSPHPIDDPGSPHPTDDARPDPDHRAVGSPAPSRPPGRRFARVLTAAALPGLLPYRRRFWARDLLAGVTLAAVAAPEAMGYARLAGMPVVTGLYTLLVPVVVFAVLGASRVLVVGADSATAAMAATALVPLAAAGSPQYVGLAAVLALMVGLLLLACRVFRLGFVANFLSHTVLIGFLTGVGVRVAAGQVPDMLGVQVESAGAVVEFVQAVGRAGSASPYALVLTALTLMLVLVPRLVARRRPALGRVPWSLVAVLVGIGLGWAAGTGRVAQIGALDGGLPSFSLPTIEAGTLRSLAGPALAIMVVVLTQSSATSAAYAPDGGAAALNRDLLGLGAANLAAGLSGTFVVNGSPTKTEVLVRAGARTQLGNLACAAVVVVVLAFATGPLAHLPQAVLAAIVFAIGVGLVDLSGLRRLWGLAREEFALAVATAVVTATVGTAQGIVLAMVVSLMIHLRKGYRPNSMVRSTAGGEARWLPCRPGVWAAPGVVVYRFSASLYYANAPAMLADTHGLMDQDPAPRRLVLDFSTIADVDCSAALVLERIVALAREKGVELSVVFLHPDVGEELDRYGLTEAIGARNIHSSLGAAMRDAHDDVPGTTG